MAGISRPMIGRLLLGFCLTLFAPPPLMAQPASQIRIDDNGLCLDGVETTPEYNGFDTYEISDSDENACVAPQDDTILI